MKNRLIPITASTQGFGLWEPALVFEFYTYLTLKEVTWEFRPDIAGRVLDGGYLPVVQTESGLYFVQSPTKQVEKAWMRLIGKLLCP